MSGKYLLDTNIIIALLNGDEGVRACIASADEVFIPIIAAGELFYGAAKSSRPAGNRAVIEEFLKGRFLLGWDVGVAEDYGQLKAALRANGTPIPENDLWISAFAKRWNLIVATRDEHFRLVPGLEIATWVP